MWYSVKVGDVYSLKQTRKYCLEGVHVVLEVRWNEVLLKGEHGLNYIPRWDLGTIVAAKHSTLGYGSYIK